MKGPSDFSLAISTTMGVPPRTFESGAYREGFVLFHIATTSRAMSRSSTTMTDDERLPNPHPGEILEEFLMPMGLSQNAEVAREAEIGVGRNGACQGPFVDPPGRDVDSAGQCSQKRFFSACRTTTT